MNTTYDNQDVHLHDRGDRLSAQAARLARRIALLWGDPISDRFARERRHDEQLLRRS